MTPGRRIVAAAVGAFLLFVLFAVIVGPDSPGTGSGTGQESVRSFDARMVLHPDGSMHVTETIVYDFGGNTTSHGIHRWIPLAVGYDARRDRVFRLTNAQAHSSSGAPATLTVSNGASADLRVGDPTTIVTGVQTYLLDYDLSGLVTEVPAGQEVDWNVTGDTWTVPIGRATVTLAGPAGVLTATCREGAPDATRSCDQSITDGTARYTAGGVLQPGQGLHITAGFPAGTFPGVWPELVPNWSWGRAFSVTPVRVLGAIALFALLTGWPLYRASRAVRRRRQAAAGAAAQQAVQQKDAADAGPPGPPKGVGAGELAGLIDGTLRGDALAATIIDLAVRGHLRIEEPDQDSLVSDAPGGTDGWRLIRGSAGAADLRSQERRVLTALFGRRSSVDLFDRGSELHDLAAAQRASRSTRRKPGRTMTEMFWSLFAAAFIGVFGLVGTILLAAMTTWGLLGAAGLLAGPVVLIAGWVAARRPDAPTPRRGLNRQVRAFERYLTTVDVERIRYDEAQQAFARYLPFAVAFGTIDHWAGVMAELTGPGDRVDPPDWYLGAGVDPEGVDYRQFGEAISALSDEVEAMGRTGRTTTGYAAEDHDDREDDDREDDDREDDNREDDNREDDNREDEADGGDDHGSGTAPSIGRDELTRPTDPARSLLGSAGSLGSSFGRPSSGGSGIGSGSSGDHDRGSSGSW